jgi:hypothetical protein
MLGAHPAGLFEALAQSLPGPVPTYLEVVWGDAQASCDGLPILTRQLNSDEVGVLGLESRDEGIEALAEGRGILRFHGWFINPQSLNGFKLNLSVTIYVNDSVMKNSIEPGD